MSSEKEILSLEDKRFAAMIAKDFGVLEPLVHEQLLYTHSSGITDTRTSWLESMKAGKVKYKAATCSDRKVRILGEVALVNGRAHIEADIGGQARTLKLLFLNAWAKTPQGWKFVAWQSCPMPSA
jgi:ketosteroid isomerase-like protein